MKRSLMTLAFALAAALAGCAVNPFDGYEVPAGQTREAVIARLGTPTRTVKLAQGERLQYSGQPFGQFAVMVDLDASGRVAQARQVLNAQDFARLQSGHWTREDVEREFGPPARVDQVGTWKGPIMTYRWNDGSDMFFWVYLDEQGVVRRAHQGMELINAPLDRD